MDYRPQWGNDGEVPINLGCYSTTQQSNGKAWFGKSFDLAQDRLTTGGSASPSTKFILSKAEGLRTGSPQVVRQVLRQSSS
jgi:hypothetical protein